MSMAQATLQDAGFAENAPSGLFYELDAQGAVRRFGLLRPGAEAGQEDGQVVEMAPDGSSASKRSWQQQIFPHPDADPDETLADWCADAQRQMLNQANHVQVCSFCEKTQSEVRKLIAGPAVLICDECAKLAHEIASQD